MNDTNNIACPVVAPIDPGGISAVLRIKNQWAIWRYTWDTKQRKWQKPPRLPDDSIASSTSPATWLSFDKVLEIYNGGGWNGISFAPLPDDNLIFFDVDGCVSKDGSLLAEVADLLRDLDTYVETTPSGLGLRAIARGHRPERNGFVATLGSSRVEIYDGCCGDGKAGGKFLTITGHRRPEFPDTIEARQQQLDAVYRRLFPPRAEAKPKDQPPPPMADDEILQRAAEAANGEKFRRLWHGDTSEYGGDASRADAGLIALLTFWTWDEAQLNRVFRRSKLLRPKWDEYHNDPIRGRMTYGQMTIAGVLENFSDSYQPPGVNLAPNLMDGVTSEAAPAPVAQMIPASATHQVILPAAFVPFPVHLLPSILRALVVETAASVVCDPTLVLLPALAVASAAIGMSRSLRMRRGHDELAILWPVPIAEIGMGKTPAFNAAVKPYFAFEIEASEKRHRELEEYEEQKEARRRQHGGDGPLDPLPFPTDEHVVVGNTTLERLADILNASPRGVLMAVDELNAWFGSHTRYSSGGASDTPHWCSLHEGVSLSISRKSFGTKIIKHPFISLAGSIQPEIFAMAMANPAFVLSGLLARLLIARPPEMLRQYREEEIPENVQNAYSLLLKNLRDLKGQPAGGPIALPVTPDARDLFIKFFNVWHGPDGPVVNAETGHAKAACIKAEIAALRLALILHVVAQVENNLPAYTSISAESMAAGIALGKWFGLEAVRVYGQYAESPETREIRQLTDLIRRKGGSITPNQLAHGYRKKYPTVECAKAALEHLLSLGIAVCGEQERLGPGRRAKDTYTLIPASIPASSLTPEFIEVSPENNTSYGENTNSGVQASTPMFAHDSGGLPRATIGVDARTPELVQATESQSNQQVTPLNSGVRVDAGIDAGIPSEPF
jgi:hypothetical protein